MVGEKKRYEGFALNFQARREDAMAILWPLMISKNYPIFGFPFFLIVNFDSFERGRQRGREGRRKAKIASP